MAAEVIALFDGALSRAVVGLQTVNGRWARGGGLMALERVLVSVPAMAY